MTPCNRSLRCLSVPIGHKILWSNGEVYFCIYLPIREFSLHCLMSSCTVPLENNFPIGILWNIPKYPRILWNIPDHCHSTVFLEYSRMLQNILKYSKILKNILEYFGIFWNNLKVVPVRFCTKTCLLVNIFTAYTLTVYVNCNDD